MPEKFRVLGFHEDATPRRFLRILLSIRLLIGRENPRLHIEQQGHRCNSGGCCELTDP